MFNLEIINEGYQTSTDLDLHQVISKPIEKLQYSKYIDDRSIALDYFESAEINSEDHLELNDHSWKVIQNNPNFFRENKEGETETSIINSIYKELLITNTVLRSDKDGFEKPLWHRHRRRDIKEVDVHYVSNGESIDVNEGFVLKGGCVYTNYKNSFDYKTSNYRIYFVSGVTISGVAFNELLNVIPAIGPTLYTDIDLETGEITNDSYTVQPNGTGYTYIINRQSSPCEDINTSSKFHYKATEDNLIKLIKPEAYSLANPWHLRVSNGSFIREGKRYWVPEFRTQPFDGQYGTIRLINKECRFVSENTIKLPVDKILIDPKELSHISVHIFDEEENILAAYTSSPTLLGTKYSDSTIVYAEHISSWDEEYGFVELDRSINSSNIIKCDFYYRADSLILNTIDVNLYTNELLIYNKIFFYLIPDQRIRSVYYFMLDENDRIIFSSNKEFKSLKADGTYNDKNMLGKDLIEFKNDYCCNFTDDKGYLELGEVTFKEDYYLDETTTFEVKTSGYLNEDLMESYFDAQHKGLQSQFGYGENGQVVQRNNLIYVKYPIELLESYGGVYKEAELIRKTKRKMRPGMDLVVDYYYPKSELAIKLSAGSVELNISWEGPGTYNLYRGLNESGEVLDENNEPAVIYTKVSTQKEDLIFIDNTTESGKKYWYSVRIDTYPKSNSYGVIAR
jgi:hypothetical protein